jgi:cardiolipin synthase
MVPTVLRRQLAPGATWAWLGVVFLHPYIGGILYILIGETRLSPRRAELHRNIVAQFRSPGTVSGKSEGVGGFDALYKPMVLQAEKISGMPIRAGNALEVYQESAQFVDRLVADIDAARTRVHLLYYIFRADETGRRVGDAVIRAAGRGVACRVLADAVASRWFFRPGGMAGRLSDAGARVAAALPVASLRQGLPRMDLRNHRKLAVIDGSLAYVGSHNLINPDYGHNRCGPWVDATARVTGPVVTELESVFCEDWAFESGEMVERLFPDGPAPVEGGVPMQVVPTGPSPSDETYRRVLLAAIQSARSQLILTTPYFVPDEPALVSLMMAADRGVDVKLILPQRPDHFFTAAAGRAHFSRLMEAGVSIHLYKPGLLHTKSTTVDNAFVLFGSANLDVRSFNLNFELSVLIYDRAMTGQMRDIQLNYLKDSVPLSPKEWSRRSAFKVYADGAVSLLSPLL